MFSGTKRQISSAQLDQHVFEITWYKVHMFWEDNTIWKNIPISFDVQKESEDWVSYLSGLLGISELYCTRCISYNRYKVIVLKLRYSEKTTQFERNFQPFTLKNKVNINT